MKIIDGVLHVCEEAVENLEQGFTAEDLEHLEYALEFSIGEALAMPGAEAAYAKVYREVHGDLPPVEP